MTVDRLISCSLLLPAFALAEVIEVPNDYSTISSALSAANPNDTVWVRPGTYSDRLIFPAHDVVVISDYFMNGDTAAVDSTTIDAAAFADQDTASVLTFVRNNSRATFVGGFTLRGGHGFLGPAGRWAGCAFLRQSSPVIHSCKITQNEADGGVAIYSEEGSPVVSHCELFENCGQDQLVTFISNQWNDDPAVFEWNNVHTNFACRGPEPVLVRNGVSTTNAYLIVRFNNFHDYEGMFIIGVSLYYSWAEVYGNVFERLTTPAFAFVVTTTDFANPIRDNLFRDLDLGEGWCVSLEHTFNWPNHDRSLVERNWFENVVNTIGPPCLFMSNPNAEVRDNVFLNCTGRVAAAQVSQGPEQGCDVLFERNHFFFNRAVGGADRTGSAFSSAGPGHPCTFLDNWFEGNEGWTVSYDSIVFPQPDLSNNYWGDQSGPFHPTENPAGLGDSVPEYVHVTPWLTSPPGMNADVLERLRLYPDDWTLEQAFPNPFNASTSLRITTAKPQPFEVDAYNILGRRVARVWQGVIPKDTPTLVHWNAMSEYGQPLPSGMYFLMAIPKGPGAGAPKTVKSVLLR